MKLEVQITKLENDLRLLIKVLFSILLFQVLEDIKSKNESNVSSPLHGEEL